MYRKGYFAICILVLFFLPSLAGTDSFSTSHSEDTDGSDNWMPSRGDTIIYGGLHLNSNQDLVDEVLFRGWAGNGSSANPFLIENLTFNARGNSYNLMLSSTTHHILIRNCTFQNATSIVYFEERASLSLLGVTNTTVENCSSFGNYQGISINGELNTVKNCTVFENQGNGITIRDLHSFYTKGNLILNNTVRDNVYVGIKCDAQFNRILGNHLINNTIDCNYWTTISNDNKKGDKYIGFNTINNGSISTSGRGETLVNNSISTAGVGIFLNVNNYDGLNYKMEANLYSNHLSGCYIALDISIMANLYALNISANNTVDGKPVYFRNDEDLTGSVFPPDGGEIIIIQCTNGSVSNLEVRSGGIYVINSQGLNIDNCTLNPPSFGIRILEGENLKVVDNIFNGEWVPVDNIDVETLYFNVFDIQQSMLYISGLGNHIHRNTLMNTSILVDSLNLEQYIGMTNTVNGKPVIYYFKEDLNGTVFDQDFGQIILYKVNDLIIENLNLSYLNQPILLYMCYDILINNCSFDNISRSAIAGYSFGVNISILRSKFIDCIYGIEMENSWATLIEECIFWRCLGGAIIQPYRTLIKNNIFIENVKGILYRYFDFAYGEIMIIDNIFLDTESYAIVIGGYNNLVYNNTFINNNWNWKELGNDNKQVHENYGITWFFDDGLKKGNFWSYHDTKDLNEDDRCDKPYIIHVGRSDRYPLTYSPHLPTVNLSGFGTNMEIMLNWSYLEDVAWPMEPMGVMIYRNDSSSFEPYMVFWYGSTGGADSNAQGSIDYGYYARIQARPVTGWQYIFGPRSNIINCSMDVIKPHLRIISPVEDLIQYENEVLFQWEGWDNRSGLTHFEIRLDGGEWEDVGLSTSRTYSDLSDGYHSFSVGCWDLANNYIAMSSHVTIDRSGPEIDIYSPRDGAHIDETAVTLKCWIIDRDSPISLINIYLDGEFYRSMKYWTEIQFGPLSEGEHYLTVEAFDELGNANSETIHFTVDLTKPEIFIESPYEGEIIQEDSVEITWNVSERDKRNRGYSIRLDGGRWYSVVDVESFTFGMLVEGHHTVEVSVKDLAGNSNYCVVNFWVQLSPITLDIRKPLEGSVLDNNTVHVSWFTQITTSTTYYLVKLDDSEWIEVWNTYHILSNLSDGDHYISIIMTDGVRNYVNGVVNFAIDTSPPILTGIYPTGDKVEVTSEIWVTFNEPIDPGSLDIYVLSVPGEIERSGERYLHVRSLDLRYATTYQVTLRCSDLLGNEMVPIMWTFKTVDRCWIRGEVLDRDGSAVSGVEIYLDGKLTGKTNKDGSYELITTSGEHEVAFKYNDWAYGLTLDPIDPGDTFNVPTIVIGEEQEGENDLNVHLIIIMNLVALSILLVVVFILVAKVRTLRELFIEDEE